MGKAKKLTAAEIESGNSVIAEFMELRQGKRLKLWMGGVPSRVIYQSDGQYTLETGDCETRDLQYHSSWEWLMPVRYKIQRIGAHLAIDGTSELCWWYSAKKTGTFSKGAGGGGGWTEKRDPFDSIFGKNYNRYVGVGDSAERMSRETEILATWDNIVYFINWLNKTCPHLRNHIYKESEE